MVKESEKLALKQCPESTLPYLPYDKYKWKCCIDGCSNSVILRDYGLYPVLYWKRKHSIAKGRQWIDIYDKGYFCSKHWSLIKKRVLAIPSYTPKEVEKLIIQKL